MEIRGQASKQIASQGKQRKERIRNGFVSGISPKRLTGFLDTHKESTLVGPDPVKTRRLSQWEKTWPNSGQLIYFLYVFCLYPLSLSMSCFPTLITFCFRLKDPVLSSLSPNSHQRRHNRSKPASLL